MDWMTETCFDFWQKRVIFLSSQDAQSFPVTRLFYSYWRSVSTFKWLWCNDGDSPIGVLMPEYRKHGLSEVRECRNHGLQARSPGQLPDLVDVRTHPPRRKRRPLRNCVNSDSISVKYRIYLYVFWFLDFRKRHKVQFFCTFLFADLTY
jgi:hypothetical protein